MRKPGRPSSSELALQPIDGGSGRPLQPPSELSEPERQTFSEIVATVKAGHFRPSDARLVGLYCQALTLARKTGEAADQDPANASPSLIRMYGQATARVCSLATKLRLTPLARSPQKSARTDDSARQASYYDIAAASGGKFTGWGDEP